MKKGWGDDFLLTPLFFALSKGIVAHVCGRNLA